MKHWQIEHNPNYPTEPDFIHYCEDLLGDRQSNNVTAFDGEWKCEGCRLEPPEVIAFCAELANCWDGTY